ncbi:hypothetical protein ACFZB9_35345 [Kitasatospora sp. NPDC008050]|uniref:hypothetical protein n=1 Tax=Kitasatospora sp. NPDC008050 TaxID=3364021 RepID=UPI0036E3EA91
MLIPNWRFFAPEPAQHDVHLLHRVRLADEAGTAWPQTNPIAERTWRQSVWFPERRRDKAMFDLCAELIPRLGPAGLDLTSVPAYRVLRDFVEVAVRREYHERELPCGYQFVIARGTGYDEEGEPEYVLVSPFHPLDADASLQ